MQAFSPESPQSGRWGHMWPALNSLANEEALFKAEVSCARLYNCSANL